MLPPDTDFSSPTFTDDIQNALGIVLVSSAAAQAHLDEAIVRLGGAVPGGAEAIPPVTSATPAGGTFPSLEPPTVTLSCADEGGSGCAATYYTLDGSDPTTSSTVYSGPFEITETSTLKFFSTDLAGNSESARSESYTSIPVFTIGGTVSNSGAAFTGWLWIDLNGDAQWSVSGPGSFAFPTIHTSGYEYTVTVQTAPPGKSCEVSNGTGTVAGANITDIVVVCQDIAVNSAPVANAGVNQNVTTGSVVTLDGSGSTDADGDPLTYAWTLTPPPSSAATLDDETAEMPSFTADVDGAYTASLVVNDGTLDSVSDNLTVTATSGNAAPVANAGPNQNVVTGSLVSLDGTGSSDANGDLLTYAWTLTPPAGSAATLDDETAEMPSFTADVDGTYTTSLVVNDGTADSAPDTLIVTAAAAAGPGEAVVYQANQDVETDTELYVGTTSGGPTIQLNGTLAAGGDVLSWKVSPDGTTVVYLADQDVDGQRELYSVPIGGGAAVKLNGILPVAGNVGAYAITPDSNTVVYTADQDTEGKMELYAVPIGGGTSTWLDSPTLAAGNISGNLLITPDSTTVVYTGDLDTDQVIEVYAAPIDGSAAAIKISGVVAIGHYLSSPLMDPTGTYVVYRTDAAAFNRWEVFSARVDGGGAVRLNTPLVTGQIYDETISADGTTVVYRDTNVRCLFAVPIAGGTPIQLNSTVAGWTAHASDPVISPDSTTVIYRHDQDTDNVYELFSVPIGGGPPTKLNETLVAGGGARGVTVSPDSTTVVYVADADAAYVWELYAVPIGGGTSVKLNGSLPAGSDGVSTSTGDYLISPDGTTVVYPADLDTLYTRELYSVPIGGGVSVKLNGTLVAGGSFSEFTFADDDTIVLYRADQDVDGQTELYAVPMTGGPAVKVNGPLVTGGYVNSF